MENKKEIKLLETIKILNGRIWNADLHNDRINHSRYELFAEKDRWDVKKIIDIPPIIEANRTVKCRIIYGQVIDEVTFQYYYRKKIESLKLVVGDHLEYAYKYADRAGIAQLLSAKGACSDIIIVKENLLTDFSYGNLAFYDGSHWYTPKTPLLKGTKRRQLLEESRIREADIKATDLHDFEQCSLINAMLDLEEVAVPVKSIYS